MLALPGAAIDLPLKILASEDSSGIVGNLQHLKLSPGSTSLSAAARGEDCWSERPSRHRGYGTVSVK